MRAAADRVSEAISPYGASQPAGGTPGPLERVLRSTERWRSFSDALSRARRLPPAAASRAFRRLAAAAERRCGAHEAARAWLELGSLHHRTGRTGEAARAFERARAAFGRAGALPGALQAASLLGLTWTDEGRLREAESVLRAAADAGPADGASAGGMPGLALARCLFWQDRAEEAAEWLRRGGGATALTESMGLRLQARIYGRTERWAEAARAATDALAAANRCGDDFAFACAAAVLADILGRAGQLACVTRQVGAGLARARRARAPMLVWRLRLTLLEAWQRGRVDSRARRELARRLSRGRLEALPLLLRLRTQLALAAEGEAARAHERQREVQAIIMASGARALLPPEGEGRRMRVVDDLVELLEISQDAEDEPGSLLRMCGMVRERLRSSAVSLIGGKHPRLLSICSAGAPMAGEYEVARRVLDANLPVAPEGTADGRHGGVAVRAAGEAVAALVCRWPPDAPPDWERAASLLTAAATAFAPAVRSVLEGQGAAACPEATAASGLLGVSPGIAQVRVAIAQAAAVPFPVLVEGESGSGKELVARAIHRASARRDRRFCAVNCAALTDDLLEAELFGHARGAFTGAVHERTGLFEEASGGTLLLDEIGELSARGQAKLLRVLQEGEIRRIGENAPRRVDVRVVAATNRRLRDEVGAGRFRADLLYRLDVVRIDLPPLRERLEDIPLLVAHYWQQAARHAGTRAVLEPETIAALSRYEWPGNVRELQNVLAGLAVGAPRRGRLDLGRLPAAILAAGGAATTSLEEAREQFERRFVTAALARAGGNRSRAARALGLSRQGLAKLLERLSIDAGAGTARASPAGLRSGKPQAVRTESTG